MMSMQPMATGSHAPVAATRGAHAWPAWLAPTIAVAATALYALLTTLQMPHGPATPGQVWGVMLGMLALGGLGGLLIGRRWAFWPLVAAYIVAVELTRLRAVGPTVDLPRMNNVYGILALVVGRGVHGLIALPALWLGVEVGATVARTPGRWRARLGAVARRPLIWLLVLLVAGLAILNALPASTPPIVDASGNPVPGSVAELATVELGGREQTILIRGQSADLPVLLYLAGGPGQSDLPFPRVLFNDLTDQVILVAWDQRGTGKSYAAIDPLADLTLEQAVADTIELAEYLRTRFGEQKVYLLGESWGSTLGVLAAQQRPDLFHAFIGSGQMVSQRETDRLLYQQLLAWADATNQPALRAELEGYGAPPYADTPYPNVLVANHYSALQPPYTPPAAYSERGEAARLGLFGAMGSEYRWIEKANVFRGLLDMFTVMYPQLQGIDFRRDVPALDVPVYWLDGHGELTARRDLALEWFSALDAPIRRIYPFANAGHPVAFEQFEALRDTVLPEVIAETYE